MKKNTLLLSCFSLLFSLVSCNNDDVISNDNSSSTNDYTSDINSSTSTDDNSSTDEIVDVVSKENRELFIKIPSDRSLKIAQFADIHFGIEGKDWHNDKVERTKAYMQSIVDNQHPDLIVCSGDNILATGVAGTKQFIELMESYQIPWIWMYGNHDAESLANGYKKSDVSRALMESNTKYLLYKEGYIEATSENRYGNYSVTIYDDNKENILGALIIMDAGTYDYSLNQYQAITSGQIDWYESEIDSLQEKYQKQSNNKYDVIPSIVFSHIQLPEFYTAYNKAKANDDAEFIIEQNLSESQIEEIKTGGPIVNTGFFEKLVAKKSTKAYFVGHAHTLNFQVKYQGITLGFGPQTGFSKLFANNNDPRKMYIYNVNDDLSFTTDCITEIVKNKGLVYNATNAEGNAKYDEDKNLYYFTTTLGTWNRVSFNYYGNEYSSDYITLNASNTTFKGKFNANYEADWTENLYFSTSTSKELICSSSKESIYKFIYSPDENTMTIEVVLEPIMEEGSIVALSNNKNSELCVWSKKGLVIKSEESKWCSDGAKLFIVVDSEGRICYSSASTGYGDLTSNDYYVHPFYETDRDYSTNPAIKITSNGYKIVVPEGGFAISAYGSSLVSLAKILIDPAYTSSKDIATIVNNRNAYNQDLRISFNQDTMVISTSYQL